MSSNLWATGWRRSVTGSGGGISLAYRLVQSLSQAVDGRTMCRGIISSCQSAATFKIVKRCCWSLSLLMNGNYPGRYTFYLFGTGYNKGRRGLRKHSVGPRYIETWSKFTFNPDLSSKTVVCNSPVLKTEYVSVYTQFCVRLLFPPRSLWRARSLMKQHQHHLGDALMRRRQ